MKPTEASIEALADKNRQNRSLRLFISSTFKDMKEERELLVKQVFPEVRRLCASRLVNFVYIDFRWGITSEDSAGGKVLDLCLGEIDKCRPYFLGILGQRYGWSQQSSNIIDHGLAETFDRAVEKHPWVDSYRDRSITEVEMLHGALFHPQLAGNAHFYLRHPDFLDSLDTISRRDFEPSSHGEQERLADLRARVEASGVPYDNYDTPEEFASMVLSQLIQIIDTDFPAEEASQLDEWDIQSQAQWITANNAHGLYVARPSFDNMLTQVLSAGVTPTIAVHGLVGSGKTSLISNWAVSAKAASSATTEGPYIVLRIIGQFSVKLHKVIMSILVELKRQFKIEKLLPSDKEEIVHSLSEWLSIASVTRPVVLILDGLEKLESTAQTLNWLPLTLPPNVHIVVSCPDNASKTMSELISREEKGKVYCLGVGDMKESERREMANKFLDQFSKRLAHEQTYLLTSAKSSANPLFMRSILELLRTFGDYDHLTEYLSRLVRARSLQELLILSLDQWVADFSTPETPTFVQDFFGCLYASRGGMLESELASILSVSQQTMWSSLLDATSFVLRNQAGLVYFSNDLIKQAIRQKFYGGADEDSAELGLHLAKYRELIVKFFESKPLSPRKIYDYPYQIVKLGRASIVFPNFLSDLKVFKTLYTEANKLDLFSYWQSSGCTTIAARYKQAMASLGAKDPSRADLCAQLGQFLHEYGEASEAGTFYDQALPLLETVHGRRSLRVAELLHRHAMLKETLGLYDIAFDLAKQSYEIFVAISGDKHPKTANSVWLQGLLKKKMGDYEAAITLFDSALTVAKSYYGENHPTVAIYLRTLADVYRNQALYEKALELYTRALKINRTTFGEVHPEVGEVLSSLGRIEKKLGNYEAARPLYEQAISVLTQLFGTKHMIVAEVYVQMADVYRKIGENKKSEELYQQALSIYRPQLGNEHPDVGEVQYLLSLTYKQTGDYEKSMVCSQEALRIAEQSFGPHHLKVAAPLGSLADVYSIIARYDDAIQLYLRALKIHEAKLGKDHPECSENLNALGMISKKRGRYTEARDYYVRSLEIVEKVFGDRHPKVAMYVHNLGVIYRKLKQHSDSMAAFQRAKSINVEVFGEDHPLVAGNMVGIALAVVKSGGDLDEARDILLKTIDIFTEKVGPNHEKVALSLNYLAEVYRKQGKFGRGGAEAVYERALKINQQCYGEWNDHPEIAENMNGLAQVYKAQFNYVKAESMFKAAIAMSERTLGANHPHVLNRYRNLALMYEASGGVAKSIEIYKTIETLKALPPPDGE